MTNTEREVKALPHPNKYISFSELVYFNRKNNAKEQVINQDKENLQSFSHSECIASV